MNKIRLILTPLFLFAMQLAMSQLNVDHPIQLTGSGANAKVTGIQNVTNSQDAVSVQAFQSGSFIYAPATGSSNNFNINISPAINAYQEGMVFNFISNQTITDSATLNVNLLGAIPIKKYVNQQLIACDILNGQVVAVVFDGVNFQVVSPLASPSGAPTVANAGPDQLNTAGTITLAADSPSSGTGEWSIDSGTGGMFSNPSSPTSSFTGVAGNAYILTWTISTALCGSSSADVDISFSSYVSGSETWTTPGAYTFIVPAGAVSDTITAYGASGGGNSTNTYGGLGAEIEGVFVVTPGQLLNVVVGQEGYYAAYGSGGGGGSGVTSGGAALIVAGGGGGLDDNSDNNVNASTTNNGNNGDPGSYGASAGGTNGGTGAEAEYSGESTAYGGNGINAGIDGSTGTDGYTTTATTVSDGSFGLGGGGGGVGESYCNCGGGGGGYSGGGAGDVNASGGGGGSYNSGTNQTNNSGIQEGNGKVTISW